MKLVIIFAVTVFLIGGGFAVAFMGFVDVPGISPINFGKPVQASQDPSRGLLWTLTEPLHLLNVRADEAAKVRKPPPPNKPDAAEAPQPEEGDLKLATFWNGLDTGQLIKVTEKWQPAALAKVLMKMDQDQVTAFLNALPPPKADQMSRAIQALASQPKPPAAG